MRCLDEVPGDPLDPFHDLLVGSHEPPDLEPGEAEGLGETIHADGPVGDLGAQGGDADVLPAVVDDVARALGPLVLMLIELATRICSSLK